MGMHTHGRHYPSWPGCPDSFSPGRRIFGHFWHEFVLKSWSSRQTEGHGTLCTPCSSSISLSPLLRARTPLTLIHLMSVVCHVVVQTTATCLCCCCRDLSGMDLSGSILSTFIPIPRGRFPFPSHLAGLRDACRRADTR